MMALALADNAFKNKFISLEQIYNLVVPTVAFVIQFNFELKSL